MDTGLYRLLPGLLFSAVCLVCGVAVWHVLGKVEPQNPYEVDACFPLNTVTCIGSMTDGSINSTSWNANRVARRC